MDFEPEALEQFSATFRQRPQRDSAPGPRLSGGDLGSAPARPPAATRHAAWQHPASLHGSALFMHLSILCATEVYSV